MSKTKEPYLAFSELTKRYYIVHGKDGEKVDVTKQVLAMKAEVFREGYGAGSMRSKSGNPYE